MSDLNLDNMDNMDFDVLREIGNIGAGNATTALSQLINAKVEMQVPKVEMLEFKEISEILGGAERLVAGILITLQGQAEGMMMFVLDQDSAHHLVNILLGKSVDNFDDFTDMELSALNEIGNIIAGAYLSSLSALTNLTITSSVPYMAIDMAGAILSVPAIEFGKIGDKALLIQSQFGEEDQYINGYFILIPTLESYNLILSSLGL